MFRKQSGKSENQDKKYFLWQKYLGDIMTAGLISGSHIESQHVYIFANISKFIHRMEPAHTKYPRMERTVLLGSIVRNVLCILPPAPGS